MCYIERKKRALSSQPVSPTSILNSIADAVLTKAADSQFSG